MTQHTSAQNDNGKEIPEVPEDTFENLYDTEHLTESKEEAIRHAERIVEDLVMNNPFALARSVAIQTYNSAWFLKEDNVSFKIALAKALNRTFGRDGYSNTVWSDIASS